MADVTHASPPELRAHFAALRVRLAALLARFDAVATRAPQAMAEPRRDVDTTGERE